MTRLVSLLAAVLLVLAGLPVAFAVAQDGGPAVGSPVTFPFEDGEVTVTVLDVADPVDEGDLDEDASVRSSERVVSVSLLVENASGDELEVDPETVFLVDADGFVYRAEDEPTLGPDAEPAELLEAVPVDDGDEAEASLAFVVPEDAGIAGVYHDPDRDRLITLALLGGAPAEDDADDADGEATPADEDEDDGSSRSRRNPTPTPEAEDEDAAATEEADDTDDAAVSGDFDCADVEVYADETLERQERLEEITAELGDLVEAIESDPFAAADDIQAYADEFQALADEQAEADVPDGLEEANELLVEGFELYAEAFQGIVDALTTGDIDGLSTLEQTLTDGDTAINDGLAQLDEAVEACGL